MKNIKTYCYFDNIFTEIIDLLNAANHSVKICVAWINQELYRETLQNLKNRGVKIEIIFNKDHNNVKYGLNSENLDVEFYPIKNFNALMHNKFCIIDDETLLTGSYNWSKNAEKHFENIVVIKYDYSLVKDFLHEFEDLKCFYSGTKEFISTLSTCSECRSKAFNVLVYGNAQGLYNTNQYSIFRVCTKDNEHYKKLITDYLNNIENYLMTDLDSLDYFNDQRQEMINTGDDKEVMKIEYEYERSKINQKQMFIDELLKKHESLPVHATAIISMTNHNEHIEWGANAAYQVTLNYIDKRYRKKIPDYIKEATYLGEAILDEMLVIHSE